MIFNYQYITPILKKITYSVHSTDKFCKLMYQSWEYWSAKCEGTGLVHVAICTYVGPVSSIVVLYPFIIVNLVKCKPLGPPGLGLGWSW